jgi:glutamate-1-semialdehyde 2,1-aminomutase
MRFAFPLHRPRERTKARVVAGLALVAPTGDAGLCSEWLETGLCKGLKPYFLYGRSGDATQCGVEEYAPEWMWKLCHRHRGILMLHLVKDAAVSDPANREALLRLSAQYPACKAILAHVGRAFNYRTARGLTALAGRPNVFVDTSAITEAESIKIALDALGVNRVLFGTDYPDSHLRGRCVTAGNSFQWIYSDTMNNPAMTLVGIESLCSLREAAEQLRLGPAEIGRLFFGNAQDMLELRARGTAKQTEAAPIPAPAN